MAFGKIVKKDVERAVCASSGFGRVYEVDSLENLYCWWHGEWRSSPMVYREARRQLRVWRNGELAKEIEGC